jgi:two-component system sensor histidine kinase PilS (NtrC family)
MAAWYHDSPEASRLPRRLLWLIALRPTLTALVLGTGLLIEANDPKALPREYAVHLGAAVVLLTAFYVVTRTRASKWPWLVDAQLIVDVFAISTVVLLTGGFHSDLVSLYVLPILAGSALRRARGGLIVAGYSSVLFGLIVASQYGLVIPRPDQWGLTDTHLAMPSPRYAFYTTGLYCVAFLTVARLTGFLAESLHRSDLKLHRASAEIADLQAWNQHVIDSMTGGLAATDAEGRVVMFNRAAEVITSYRACDVRNRDAADILQLPDVLRRELASVAGGERGHRIVYSFQHRDGCTLELGLSVGPLITSTGRGYLFTFQDLTELRRAEREAELQKRLAAIGEMAAGIAHEIRNPLASMSGSMQVLRDELNLLPEQAQLFDIVLRESERLNHTIRDFLSYARPQNGEAAEVDMAIVVRDAGWLLRNSPDCTSQHQVEVDTEESIRIQAVEPQMRQIVWNLATNALRAMPAGGTLRLSCHRDRVGEDPGVVLAVADNGVGIPAEDVDRIFQPFHGGFAKGAGLGLAIVHRIVTEHAGAIHVTSDPGHGTTIQVRLPGLGRIGVAA